MLTIADLMNKCMDYPIERHHLIPVKIQIFDKTTDEPWTQEQHDALDAEFELLMDDPGEE